MKESKSVRIQVLVTPTEATRFQKAADAEGVSLSQFVRESVSDRLSRSEKAGSDG